LSQWATEQFGLSASHPAGKDETGKPRKNLWPPPEGSAALPPEEKNPLIKLLMDVSMSQETLFTYFSTERITSTEGFSGSLFDIIRETSPLARQPCV
jgi:hypothetical protein